MHLPDLQFDFYGALIHQAQLGPRRELTLHMELWPMENGMRVHAWRSGEGKFLRVRFGGIENYEQVSEFFTGFSASRNAHESLHFLRYAPAQKSKPGALVLELGFDNTGDRPTIECSNLTILENEP